MKFKQGVNPNQEVLFPKKISEYLPENHMARAVKAIVQRLDLSQIESKYSEKGQHAYDPKMMTGILFYGYGKGVRSSRDISKGCEEGFDFVFLSDGLKPSHDRISDFRKDNLKELERVFQEVVLIGANLGLVELGNIKVSIDGAKIRANASAKFSKDEKGLKKLMEKTNEKIKQMLEEAEEIDKKEDKKYGKDKRGDELPKKLQREETRKKAIEEAIEKLKEQKKKVKTKIREDKRREPTKAELEKVDKMKMNVTDNDAKFMKERCGVIKPNYNAQISVDEKGQLILANNVVDECNDQSQLVPMLKKTKENIKENPKKAKADNGYIPQLEEAHKLFPETDLYVDDKNRRREDLDMDKIKEEYSDVMYKNLKKLLTRKGEKEYKKRMHTAEPLFGNFKFNLGYRYFLLKGLDNTKGEFNLMCIAHNLKKITTFIMKKENMTIAGALLKFEKNKEIKREYELVGENSGSEMESFRKL